MKSNKIRLGEQCIVTSSKRFHLSERITQGVPFYCSKEIIKKFNGEDVTECDYISEDLYENVSNEFGVPKENDLLITTRGTIGVPYLYKRTDRFYFSDGNLTWIKDFDSNLHSKFLYYWFQSYEGQKKIEALAKGTAQKAVPISGIKTLEIDLPPLNSQKRIADILSAYDDLIENNQKQIKLLEEAAQRLYKEWFVDLRFPGHENTKIVDGVPEGWSRTNINEILTFHRGYDLTKNEMKAGRYPVVGSTTVIGYHNEFKIKGPGIVTGRSGSLGKYQFIWDNFWPHNTSLYISDYKDHNIFFVYSLLQTVDFASLNNGGAIPTLNRNVLSNIEVIEPEKKLQDVFAKIAEPQYQKIRNLEKQNDRLKTARGLLLPKLMSGEVEV